MNDLSVIVLIIGLPVLFVIFFPIICMIFGAVVGVICFCIPFVISFCVTLFTMIASLFLPQPKAKKQTPVLVADMVVSSSPAKPMKPIKKPQPKKQTHTYTEIEMDVAHGLKGLGVTLKDAKTLVKKVTEKNTYSDTVSLMNACLEAINTR